MIDNNMAELLDALAKDNFEQETNNLVQAIAQLNSATTKVQDNIKRNMVKTIVDNWDPERRHTLEKAYNQIEELNTELSGYMLFATTPINIQTESPTVETTVTLLPPQNTTKKAIVTDSAHKESVKRYFDERLELTEEPTPRITPNTVYKDYVKFASATPSCVKMTNYNFYKNLEAVAPQINKLYTSGAQYYTNIKLNTATRRPVTETDIKIGTLLEHKQFGLGNIISTENNNLRIKFTTYNEAKTFQTKYVLTHDTFTVPILV